MRWNVILLLALLFSGCGESQEYRERRVYRESLTSTKAAINSEPLERDNVRASVTAMVKQYERAKPFLSQRQVLASQLAASSVHAFLGAAGNRSEIPAELRYIARSNAVLAVDVAIETLEDKR